MTGLSVLDDGFQPAPEKYLAVGCDWDYSLGVPRHTKNSFGTLQAGNRDADAVGRGTQNQNVKFKKGLRSGRYFSGSAHSSMV